VPIGALRNRGSDGETRSASGLTLAFEVRQSRAGRAQAAVASARRGSKIRPIAQQFAPSFMIPIKAAPLVRNIDPQSRAIPQPWP